MRTFREFQVPGSKFQVLNVPNLELGTWNLELAALGLEK